MKLVNHCINLEGRRTNFEDRYWNIITNFNEENNILHYEVVTYANTKIDFATHEVPPDANAVYNPEDVKHDIHYRMDFYQVFAQDVDISTLSLYDHAVFAITADDQKDPIIIPAFDQSESEHKHDVHTNSYVIDLLKSTYTAKISRNEYCKAYGKLIFGYLIVPFADSTTDEMIFVMNNEVTANVSVTQSGFSEVLPDVGRDFWNQYLGHTGKVPRKPVNDSCMRFLPKISAPDTLDVSINSTTDFTVQLVDFEGNVIPRAGVTIYLENTGGLLNLQRIVTDANGSATAKISVGEHATAFKVKTGFKYFSGMTDTIVNVT